MQIFNEYIIISLQNSNSEGAIMKVAFYTLGCKVNQYETEVIRSEFIKKGFDTINPDETADVYVVNSCSVTAMSDKKSRQQVRHFKKMNPDSVVVLTGCFSQSFPEKAKEINIAMNTSQYLAAHNQAS